MSARPSGWWPWHMAGAACGVAVAWAVTRDPWTVALTAATAAGWSAGRHRLAPWLGGLVGVLYGAAFAAAWLAWRRHGGGP